MNHMNSAAAQSQHPSTTPPDIGGDLFSVPENTRAQKLITAAEDLLDVLCKGEALRASVLRSRMVSAFGGSDNEGLWQWRDVYEAQEIASLLFIRKYHDALMRLKPAQMLQTLDKLQSFLATQTRRSDTSQRWQQFSTPLPFGFALAQAANIQANDMVLEPSAGTGLLAIFAQGRAAHLHLNELEAKRHALLHHLFEEASITSHNGEYLNDLLDDSVQPSVIMMNPPFSTSPTMSKPDPAVAGRHIFSALHRLKEGGRLVAITGRNFAPVSPMWRDAFIRLQGMARVSFSAPLSGNVYAKHGTTVETRLTVFDKCPADDPKDFSAYHPERLETVEELLELIQHKVPERLEIKDTSVTPITSKPVHTKQKKAEPETAIEPVDITKGQPLDYQTLDWVAPDEELRDCLYEPYVPQSVLIENAQEHPTPLVQSAAMASVAPPQPSYQPDLPQRLITEGVLSDAQLESIIYAGQAHSRILPGVWTINQHYDFAGEGEIEGTAELQTVQFRQGWFLGDGTGCGKGRQVAGIILDNRLKGRKQAIWISKNDKLLEDARRDWAALGGDPKQVVPLSKFKQGQPIHLQDGILFATYGTLRTGARQGKKSRLDQIVEWLGNDFDGPVMFDESHALANATTSTSGRGVKAASMQGRAGLRLQRALPMARVVYVSATGATNVHNLAYAERLGLWGEATAFNNRSSFINAMEAGGVAAMEVISRDLKAMGLYSARSLSYDGVEVDILEHELTPEQVEIYDSFAKAYHVIHQHLQTALDTLNIAGELGTLNKNAKSSALSAFEGAKQRFFNHLLTAMKCPTLIKSIEGDIERGDAVIVQLVSTGQALLERRLSDIPSSEWNDLSVDITPREYVLDYLAHSFPTQLFEVYSDEDGNQCSRPMMDDRGNPVMNKAVVAKRDAMIEHLASLPAVPSALDQILHHFGAEAVAEVTGRSIRLVREEGVLKVQKRPASSNLDETQAYMDDKKRILVFSDAGGTGRSYHADRDVKNSRHRVHYLLEPGWRADNAIQGLGRSNRTNQASAPLFRPVATNVKGEKRFLSTIARRLDSLGAITKGQRQTGGQGMFRSEDNLESSYARAALRQLYRQIIHGKVPECSLEEFEEQTGLSLLDQDGSMREEMPPMSRFLNRVLALTINRQNALFEAFGVVLEQIIEGARASGMLDVGLETLQAESFTIFEAKDVYTHEETGAKTQCLTITRKDKLHPTSLERVMSWYEGEAKLLVNARSGRAALQVPALSRMSESGAVQACVRLYRPQESVTLTEVELITSKWEEVAPIRFKEAWESELATLQEYQTSTFYLVTGLLLPIWDRMTKDNLRIYRLQSDDDQRLLGRVLQEKDLSKFYNALGLDAPKLSLEAIKSSVLEDGASYPLAQGLRLRRTRIMGEYRMELEYAFGPDVFDRLSKFGCFSEIIQYKKRAFIPINAQCEDILERVLAHYPMTGDKV